MSFVTVAMNPAQAQHNMRREIERLLQDVVPVRPAAVFIPAANGYEEPDGFRMEFDVPGFALEHLDVTAQDGMLIVRGNKADAELAEGTRALFTERTAQSFERTLRLPKTADLAAITANYANGVLTVHVAKLATVAPRKVTINAGQLRNNGSSEVGTAAAP